MKWKRHCKRVAAGKVGFPIVEIVWHDAVAFGTDWETEAPTGLRLTTTVGYLVAETKEALSLAAVINSEHVGHGIVVPKSCVIKRSKLGVQ